MGTIFSSRALVCLFAAGFLFAVGARAEVSPEEEGTAGALSILEGLDSLKKEEDAKKSAALVEQGSRTIQKAWMSKYLEKNSNGQISASKSVVNSATGKKIVNGFSSSYGIAGTSLVSSLINSGGSMIDIEKVVSKVNAEELRAAIEEFQAVPHEERAELLSGSNSQQLFKEIGISPAQPSSATIAASAASPAYVAAPKKSSSGASWTPGILKASGDPQGHIAEQEIVVKQSAMTDLNSGGSSSSGRGTASTGSGSSGSQSSVSYTAAQKKIGINFGTNSVQGAVDGVQAIGGWYYNYSPYPDRADSHTTYNTVAWANKYGKEFVPMVSGRRFKFGAGDDSCPITEYYANTDSSGKAEKICDPDQMANSLIQMKKLFTAGNQPRYLLNFNAPHTITKGAKAASDGVNYAVTPWQAALAFTRLQYAAKKAGLKMVSPSTTYGLQSDSVGQHSTDWMAMFLKRCHDMSDDAIPCDLESIHAFAVNEQNCREDYWNATYAQKGFQKLLISKMKNDKGAFYGGRNWESYINSRKIWVTETNCNWEPDFQTAHSQGKYIRTQAETCKRATGQKSTHGKGSLAFLVKSSSSVIERFAWWNTYADPQKDSDGESVTESSRNRIGAVRLLDDNFRLTPSGRAYLQAFENPDKLGEVDCDSI